MINREDMLELTRRMTPARTSFVRMAGCYTDSDGEYDGQFQHSFSETVRFGKGQESGDCQENSVCGIE